MKYKLNFVSWISSTQVLFQLLQLDSKLLIQQNSLCHEYENFAVYDAGVSLSQMSTSKENYRDGMLKIANHYSRFLDITNHPENYSTDGRDRFFLIIIKITYC